VTRKKGEEIHPDCILAKVQRKKGWMFWGSFSGGKKGPCLFWEKEWGSINAESYQEHIVPLIDGWIRLELQETGRQLVLMQDHAPGHAAATTREDLLERLIEVVNWPPFSPDLNPIETIWNWMKDWIEEKYEDKQYPYEQLRKIVKEAWDEIPDERLIELLNTMPQRCQDVITAKGGYTKW
jgi:transposase